jgi:hypothetical protein
MLKNNYSDDAALKKIVFSVVVRPVSLIRFVLD